jgi:RHS repeat-associated protein
MGQAFVGRFDATSGLYHFRHRDYFPTTGRWTTPDPLGFAAGDVNLYRYVGNTPTLATDPSGYSEQLPLWVQFVNAWDNVLGHPRTGWFAQISNGAAGMADTVSLELASRLRQWVGYDDVVDYHSAAYFGGQLVGTGVNLGLGFANPCAMGRTLGQGLRWLTGVQAVGGSINAGENLAAGNYGAAVLDLVGVAGNSFQMRRPCFPGDVQVLTRRGWVRWDGLRAGDEVLSLPEDEPQGELAYRRVEEVFQRWSVIWEVVVGGQVLRTMAEHPFWVRGRGWTAASQLRVGDELRSHDGQWVAVEGVRNTGREEAVYNCRVAEYHTYFVGDEQWGFSRLGA